MAETVFAKILRHEIPAKIVHEDDQCIAFHDVTPKAPVHIIVIPRKPIESLDAIEAEDQQLLGHLLLTISKIARSQNLSGEGYRVVMNCGADGGQTVQHLHFHILGGRTLKWPPG